VIWQNRTRLAALLGLRDRLLSENTADVDRAVPTGRTAQDGQPNTLMDIKSGLFQYQ
jgi:hypothetical protein